MAGDGRLETDAIVDRRSLRRRLAAWRIAAFVFLAIALVAGLAASAGKDMISSQARHIARVSIDGVIDDERKTIETLESVGKSGAVAVLLRIDSPGGTTSGAEALHAAIRALAEKKPTVAVVDGIAASGGYIAALGADAIVARGNALVGSIGVLFQYPNVTDLMRTVGVKVEEVKSAPLKAAPNPFEPTSPEARAVLETLVRDTFVWFRDLVKDRRRFDDGRLAEVTDGRVFTGRQGLALGLVDRIGGETEALALLKDTRSVDTSLPVRDWRIRSRSDGLDLFGAADALGLSELTDALRAAGRTARLATLDGLLAVWQPPAQSR